MSRLSRIVAVALIALTPVTAAFAGAVGDFESSLRRAYADYRAALFFTNAGNGDKAAASVTAFKDQWAVLTDGAASPPQYADDAAYAATAAEDAVQGGTGVCQDHAHIFIAAARSAGVPARYVSGYLRLDETDDQEAGHAWAEAWLPDLGWVGFDISNVQCPDDRYVRLASGLDYREAAPLTGLRRGFGNESMIVTLQVQQ